MPTYAVIGGSRGVGLEIVRQLVRSSFFNWEESFNMSLLGHAAGKSRVFHREKRRAVGASAQGRAGGPWQEYHATAGGCRRPSLIRGTGHYPRMWMQCEHSCWNRSQRAAEQVARVTGGSLDLLIYNAAKMEYAGGNLYRTLTE